jgi:acyl phosphate:glycerol-3-phosphate acyltransferase
MEKSYLLLLICYLLGSIPFGLLLTKIFLKKDIREIGSKNIGATNVLRLGNKKIAALTLLLDIFKSYIAVKLVIYYKPEFFMIAFFCVIIGHLYPIWLRFKGGKGVASYLGAIFAINALLGVLFAITWLLVFYKSKISALAAIITLILMPIYYYFMVKEQVVMLVIISALIIIKHHSNIVRILNKSELKIKE